MDPLWSIAVEEQFYICIPFLSRIGGKKLLTIISILLLIIAVFVNLYYARLVYSGESGQWVNSWFQFQFFAAGALLAIFLKGRLPSWSFLTRFVLFILALSCWFYAVYGLGVKSYDAHLTIAGALIGWWLVLIGSVLFFLAALGIQKEYIPRFLTYPGRISFGLYMFHSLVFHLIFNTGKEYLNRLTITFNLPSGCTPAMGIFLTIITSIAIASASYTFFERPFLKLKQRFTFVHSRPE